MDNAWYLGLVLGLDEQHQAAVALGDDGFLDDGALLIAAEAALHYVVKLLVGGTGVAAELPKLGAGVVEDFSGGAYGPADGLGQKVKVGYVAGNAGQEGQVFTVTQGLAAETGGFGQLPDVVKFLAPQDAAQGSPVYVLAKLGVGAEFQAAAVVQELAGLVGLLEAGSDFQGIAHGFQGQAAFPPQGGAGVAGQPLAYLVEFQQAQGAVEAAEGGWGPGILGITAQVSPG